MFTVIFGRSGCPYCVRAKELAEKLKHERNDFDYNYVDIQAEGITKADLAKKAGKPVETVPQIRKFLLISNILVVLQILKPTQKTSTILIN